MFHVKRIGKIVYIQYPLEFPHFHIFFFNFKLNGSMLEERKLPVSTESYILDGKKSISKKQDLNIDIHDAFEAKY